MPLSSSIANCRQLSDIGISDSKVDVVGIVISFVIVYEISLFVTPWLKLLEQLRPGCNNGRSKGKANEL